MSTGMGFGIILILIGCAAILTGFWLRDFLCRRTAYMYAGYDDVASIVGAERPSLDELIRGIENHEWLLSRRYLQCDEALVDANLLEMPHLNVREAFSEFRRRRLEGLDWRAAEEFLDQCVEVLQTRKKLEGCPPTLSVALDELHAEIRAWILVVNWLARTYHVVSKIVRTN